MPIVAKLDEFGRPAWILLIVLGFMAWWPAGLAILAMAFGSGRIGCGSYSGSGRWPQKMDRMQAKMDRMRRGSFWEPPASGNHAFDEYRTETLRRLEDEQREFQDFLARLRMAKDKSEFDQFMAERRSRGNPDPQPQS
jgi:hypothetical protein